MSGLFCDLWFIWCCEWHLFSHPCMWYICKWVCTELSLWLPDRWFHNVWIGFGFFLLLWLQQLQHSYCGKKQPHFPTKGTYTHICTQLCDINSITKFIKLRNIWFSEFKCGYCSLLKSVWVCGFWFASESFSYVRNKQTEWHSQPLSRPSVE